MTEKLKSEHNEELMALHLKISEAKESTAEEVRAHKEELMKLREEKKSSIGGRIVKFGQWAGYRWGGFYCS